MDVRIKKFDVNMQVKTNGIELQVSAAEGQVGDCYVTKTGVIWCAGRTRKPNGVKLTWAELQVIAASPEAKAAALKAARAAEA